MKNYQSSSKQELAVELQKNAQSGEYPFHMPGHKRNSGIFRMTEAGSQDSLQAVFDEICRLDITEIEGFDNLHDPKGILKECMEHAARVCGSEVTYFLVNGSSCGNIAAILASVPKSGKLIVARNCHKSVYHAITLHDLTPCYILPDYEQFCREITPEQVEEALLQNPDAEAVMITSPTYEGVVSDIEAIAEVVHRYDKILIVDEAHGAHFGFHPKFPDCAHHLGADLSIQSVHKTLTGFTQSAVLQCNHDRVDRKRLEEALRMVQSSSPSYLLMAGLDRTYHLIEDRGKELFEQYYIQLEQFRKQAAEWKNFRLFTGKEGFFDPSKLVILCENLVWEKTGKPVIGQKLLEQLKSEYGLVLEMGAYSYVIAMTSIADREEGFRKLLAVMNELDSMVEKIRGEKSEESDIPKSGKENSDIERAGTEKTDIENAEKESSGTEKNVVDNRIMLPEKKWNPAECFYRNKAIVSINKAEGKVAGSYVYLYPPGIPILVPGEVINRECIQQIKKYSDVGMEVKGMEMIEGSLMMEVLV